MTTTEANVSVAIPLAGDWYSGDETIVINNPFDGEAVGAATVAGAAQVERALDAAASALPELQAMEAWQRAERLQAASRAIGDRREELARLISLECGKPIREARGEALRASYTFQWAAEEAKRLPCEWIPLDTEQGLGRRAGLVRRFPVGPLLAVTPFNFPLNLVCHKLAPALAVGAPVLLKPSLRTPLTTIKLAEIVLDADWPAGTVSVLTVSHELTDEVLADGRVAALSFTGSEAVGWALRREHPRLHMTLELGGNAPVLIEPDADLDRAAQQLVVGAFAYAGQVCISTQRILVHESVHDAFLERFAERTRSLRMGDPLDESADIGPLIDADAAGRVREWIREAVDAGATVVAGGGGEGNSVEPTILSGVPRDARCWTDEVFGPVASVAPYRSLDDGFELANSTRFGLHAAIFTERLETAMLAHERIHAGGIVVNDAPFFRAVQMPYGGVKDSGLGREGVRAAMLALTEPRLLVLPMPTPGAGRP